MMKKNFWDDDDLEWRQYVEGLVIKIQRKFRERLARKAAKEKEHPSLPPSYVPGRPLWERSWVMYFAANLLCYEVRNPPRKFSSEYDRVNKSHKNQIRAYCMMRHLFSGTMWVCAFVLAAPLGSFVTDELNTIR